MNIAVLCGAPPEPTVNGSRVWIDLDYNDDSIEVISIRKILLRLIIYIINILKNIQLDAYNTRVQYRCKDGSQFDTDGDGEGDTPMVEIRCQVRTEMICQQG